MKKLLFFLSLLISFAAQAQIMEPIKGYGYSWNRGEFSVFLTLPQREDTLFSSTDRAKLRNGSAFFNTADSTIWVFYNNSWRAIQGSGGADGNNYPSSVSLSGGTLTIARTGLSSITATINTTEITEGTNLYFTNARARSALSTGNSALLPYNSSTGQFNLNISTTDTTRWGKDIVYEQGNNMTLTLRPGSVSDTVNFASAGVSTAKLDTVTTNSFEAIIAETNNHSIALDSSTITSSRLVGKNPYLVALDGIILSSLANPSVYYSFDKTAGAITLYNGKFSADSYVNVLFDKQVFPEVNLVLVGNSMLNGAQTSEHRANAVYAIVQERLGVGIPGNTNAVHNKSVGNRALYTTSGGAASPSMIGGYAANIRPLLDPDKRNVILVWEQLNELYYSLGKANTIARLRQYCDTLRADGWEVIVVTVPGKTAAANAGFNTTPTGSDDTNGQDIKEAMLEVNDTIRATYTQFADHLIDIASLPELEDFPDGSDLELDADGIHFSDYGNYIVGFPLADSLLSILEKSAPNKWYVQDNASTLTAYKAAAGITGSTRIAAYNTAFSKLSQAGLWQYISHWYPINGTGSGWKVDAKNPTAPYNLIDINPGGGTDILSYHVDSGLTTRNNARVEIPRKDTTLWEPYFTIGIRTNKNTAGGVPYVFGSGNLSGKFHGSDFRVGSYDGSNTSDMAMDFPAKPTGADWYAISRDRIYRHQMVGEDVTSTLDQKVVLSASHYNNNIPFGCYYFDGTPTIFPATVSLRFIDIIVLRIGLPPEKLIQLYDIIEELETTLGRAQLN